MLRLSLFFDLKTSDSEENPNLNLVKDLIIFIIVPHLEILITGSRNQTVAVFSLVQ